MGGGTLISMTLLNRNLWCGFRRMFPKMEVIIITEHLKLLQQTAHNTCLVLLIINKDNALNWTKKQEALIQQHTCEFQHARSSSGAKERMFPWLQRDMFKCFSGQRPSGVR